MLALIQNNQIVKTVSDSGWFTLPDGASVSPPYPGWTGGGYTLSEIEDADAIPEGKKVTNTSVQMVGGKPKFVHQLEDAGVEYARLTRWQWLAIIDIAGLMPTLDAFLASLEDPVSRTIIQHRITGSDYYDRFDALTIELIDKVVTSPENELTIEQVNQLWKLAETFTNGTPS